MATMTKETETISHFLGGRITSGSGKRVQDVYNPATGLVTGQVHLADPNDIENAVVTARKAAESWSQVPQASRREILFGFRERLATEMDNLARIITAEHGKTINDAKGEIKRSLEAVEFACGLIEQLKGEYSDQAATNIDVYSYREPLGVVAGITPFNFPILPAAWMAPLAIATGNTFVLKPSERDPSASLVQARLWQEAGLPDGVFNVLQGDREAVDGLLTHPDIDGVSFIGSTPVAKHVHETATLHGKRVQALGGAKNHAVVMPDADIDLAAEHIGAAAFGAAGERCMAVSVVVAVGNAADTLAHKLKERANSVTVAEGTDSKADMGPLITQKSKERVSRIVSEAESDGACLVADGRGLIVDGYEKGFFFGPTVLDHVKIEMSAYKEEIFGPVLVIMRVPDLEAAIKLINSNPYGNGTGIFTNSGASARRFRRSIKVGMVGINVPIPVPIAWHSFGGWNDSLFGDLHVNGSDGVRFYTRNKAITERWPESTHESDASFAFPSHN